MVMRGRRERNIKIALRLTLTAAVSPGQAAKEKASLERIATRNPRKETANLQRRRRAARRKRNRRLDILSPCT